MKLKFKKAVAVDRKIYHVGTVAEIKDAHAAEVYIKHGYAEPVEAGQAAASEGQKPAGPAKRD